ncbi:ATP-binding protein [Listeria monocytogenes]|uniref:ATP-binding protein n=1 Tax=Listeria monocytogenes TaxID=1639 RepID=UPI00197C2E06|nr:ATP-binding protein [Listeria monocytogenes]MDA5960463.1 ATP-binding protein [Listeria monocytogenes]
MINYIFLAGVHGSGKSTLSKRIHQEISIDYTSVSDLIRIAGELIAPNNKSTTGINKNQILWKNELNNINNEQNLILLDGHFCLLNKENKVEILPEDTFDDTNMIKIVLVTNTAETIFSRLQKRDDKDYSIDLLKEFIETEEKQAHLLSQVKKIPLFIYNEKEPFDDLLNFLTEI